MPPTLTQFDLRGWAVPNLNLLDVKLVPYVKENKFILDISLDMCILLSDITIVDCLQRIRHVCCLPVWCT